MSTRDHETGQPLATLADLGRRQVAASADLPREALRFLGTPTVVRGRRPPSGAAPGHMVVPLDAPKPVIRVMAYSSDRLGEYQAVTPTRLRELTEQVRDTLWIEVEGFGDREVLTQIGEALGIHALAMADVVHVPQRPKTELYDGRLLLVTQMARFSEAGEVLVEQISLVLGPNWVATFKEEPCTVFDPLRERIRSSATRIRHSGADYLAYALLDAVVDGYFPVIEALGGVVDALEEEVIERASHATLARIHATRRTLLMLHRVQWRQRDAVNAILRDEGLPITEAVKPYFRDAHDHAFQILDMIESYRDMVTGLMDLHLSASSNRINEVMKTLTIVATIFIPLTFLAGVYGMNFDYMPELRWRWGYPAIWGLMILLGACFLLWVRQRHSFDTKAAGMGG